MRETGSPEYEPPASDQTLQQWLAGSSQDWLLAQPTMWLPAFNDSNAAFT